MQVRARCVEASFFLPFRSTSSITQGCGSPQYPIVTSASLYPIDIESFDRHGSWEDRRIGVLRRIEDRAFSNTHECTFFRMRVHKQVYLNEVYV